MHFRTVIPSLVGDIYIAANEVELTGIWIGTQNPSPQCKEPYSETITPLMQDAVNWLERYFAGEKPLVKELPLHLHGTPFAVQVWELLCEIPYGETVTYGELAKKIAKKQGISKMSAQAVGGAVGHNPFAIVIPCHRVIGTNGNLTGYTGGLDKKICLMEHEGMDMSQYHNPKRNA